MIKLLLKKETWLPVVALILIGSFIYVFNLHNGLFWDDDEWIVNNLFVHDISWTNIKFWFSHNTLAGVGLKSNYYRPFLFFTFAFNYILAGLKPLVYHLTSNATHIFNALLVFWLIRQIFKRKLLAFLVAVFFLVHPLQTEAIAYISGRGDALGAMFMLLALALFYKVNRPEVRGNIQLDPATGQKPNYRSSERVEYTHRSFWISKILSIIFLVLGLLSRETGIIFPLLALALYITVLSRQRFLISLRRGLVKTWPYFAVVIIYGMLRLTALNFLNTLNFYTEPNLYSENLQVRLFTFLPILWEYLKLLLVPLGLHMERGGVVYTSFFQWPVWGVALVLVSLLGWLKYLYRQTTRDQKPQQVGYGAGKQQETSYQIWLLGSLWFFIALGPVSGIAPINALMYEHWLYLPMVGFWLIVSFYLVKLFDFLKFKKKLPEAQGNTFSSADEKKYVHRSLLRILLIIVLVGYFSFFGYQSIQRNILWGRPAEFYQDILRYEPESARISNNLGNLYFNQGNKEQAEIYYRKAVEAGDDFPQPYFNLGSMLQAKGDIFGAVQLFEKAIEINPNFYYPYQNLAVIYAQQGQLTKAKENIEKLKSLLPNNPRVFYNSALVYLALNNKAQALADLKEGIKYSQLDPEIGELMEKLVRELESRKIK